MLANIQIPSLRFSFFWRLINTTEDTFITMLQGHNYKSPGRANIWVHDLFLTPLDRQILYVNTPEGSNYKVSFCEEI